MKRILTYVIAEQTNLAGQVQTEISCLPVENTEYQQYMAMEPKVDPRKPRLREIKDPLEVTELKPRDFGSFTVGTPHSRLRRTLTSR